MPCRPRRAARLAAALAGVVLGLVAAAEEEAPSFERFLDARDLAAAQAHAEARLAADAGDVRAGADLAQVILLARERDRYDEAVALLERAIAAEPRVAHHHFILGRIYGAQARSAGLGALALAGKVRAAFSRAIELEPENFEYVYALNEFYLEAPFIAGGGVGRARKAARAFAATDADAGAMLEARILIREGQPADAAKRLRALPRRNDVTLDATRRNLLTTAGRDLTDAGRASQAVPVLEAVTEEFPNNARGHLGLGRARLGAGDVAGAIEALGRSLEISRDAETLYRLGLAYQAAGEAEKARRSLRESLERGGAEQYADDIRRRLDSLGG